MALDHESFITLVAQRADLGWDAAERATRVVLETLGERIAQGEARDIADELPPELAPYVATTTDAEGFDVDEFVRRVAEREGVDPGTAERHIRAVFTALGRALSPQALRDLGSELSKDYAPLLPRGPYVEVLSTTTFVQRVADRAAVYPDDARRLTDAVLETLAERIAGGQAEDLADRLPLALHEPLHRGAQLNGGKATRMSLDDFLRRVAERAGVDLERARDATRAVLLTLREAVGDDEFFDTAVELPEAYRTELELVRR
jgi:uncharacterized protein (DUF2267 family)